LKEVRKFKENFRMVKLIPS